MCFPWSVQSLSDKPESVKSTVMIKPVVRERWNEYRAVCDETQNLNETESETFFRYQIFSIPNPILFPIPIFLRYRYRYFFRYQNFTKPIPILFFDTKIFRNRYRYFFRYQFFSETDTDTFFETKFF